MEPFKIKIPQEQLNDLNQRLKRIRWPDEIPNEDWSYGTNLSYLEELMDYWLDNFDWRSHEKELNKFNHYRAHVDDFGIHFIHEKGKGENPLPIILLHGWPATFQQMLKLIPLLTDPEKHGGESTDSFDVIIPSLPGYGFSERPVKKGMTITKMADLIAELMNEELEYKKYAIRSSDIGAGVAQQLAIKYPELVIGLHQNGANPSPNAWNFDTKDLSESERKYLSNIQNFWMMEGAYSMIQATKPQTLAYGLNDSPAGLAAWIIEKYRSWSDCDGDIEKRFTKDELLVNLTIYWVTETINSSIRIYYESLHGTYINKRVELPTAITMFLNELGGVQPRELVERQYNIQHWTDMPRGGHFSEWEEPELVANDIRQFFRSFR